MYCQHFRVICCLEYDSACWSALMPKFYSFIKVSIRSLEEIKIYLSVSDGLRTDKIFISNLDVKLVGPEATTFNLHVFMDWPSRVSSSVHTHRRSPFLELSDAHVDKGIHFFEKTWSKVSCKMALKRMNSHVSFVPINYHILLHHWLLYNNLWLHHRLLHHWLLYKNLLLHHRLLHHWLLLNQNSSERCWLNC